MRPDRLDYYYGYSTPCPEQRNRRRPTSAQATLRSKWSPFCPLIRKIHTTSVRSTPPLQGGGTGSKPVGGDTFFLVRPTGQSGGARASTLRSGIISVAAVDSDVVVDAREGEGYRDLRRVHQQLLLWLPLRCVGAATRTCRFLPRSLVIEVEESTPDPKGRTSCDTPSYSTIPSQLWENLMLTH